MWLVDVHGVRRFTKPFIIYGTNPMVAFVGSGLVARMIYSILKVNYGGQRIALQSALYQSLFASWLSPVNASLAFALTFVLFWYVVLALLYRRNIVFKV
jgi:predicted acyltransferase